MTHFKASVQYGDWEGTSAADNSDTAHIHKYLGDAGLIKDGEFLVAAELYVGENHGGNLGRISIRAFLFAGTGYDTVKDALEATADPIPVRVVDIEIGLNEFFGLFKRFSVSLTHRGLNLEGREYEEI